MTANPAQGEVWWVRFDPVVGSEANKSRPALVVSSENFHHTPMRLVVPFTTWSERHRFHKNKVRVGATEQNGLEVDSAADVMQLRAVAVERFELRAGILDTASRLSIGTAIAMVTELRHPDLA